MMTAKENFDFINKIYGAGGPVIREHNGFIDKYIGDATMAIFNAPFETEDYMFNNETNEIEFTKAPSFCLN